MSRKTTIESELRDLEQKYFDLAWYSRKIEEDRQNPVILPLILEVERKYPKETSDYTEGEGEGSVWHAGFFNGMLASTRLFIGLLSDNEQERQQARDEFPFMDT